MLANILNELSEDKSIFRIEALPILNAPLNIENITYNKKNLSEKRQLGAFYTPKPVAESLVKWAIREQDDIVLEPSFGGCGFLQASFFRFKEIGNDHPDENIFGCDIDPSAFHHLHELFGAVNIKDRFLLGDFLSLHEDSFSAQYFDAVVGNPPYISRHNMSSAQKKLADLLMKNAGEKNGRASLWASFVIHSLAFLRKGGRIAWVLPTALLTSSYAAIIRKIIEKNFKKTICISLGARLFLEEGTEEGTVVLLAEGYQDSSENLPMIIEHAVDVNSLNNVIENWEKNKFQNVILSDRYLFSIIEKPALDAFFYINKSIDVCCFGDVATILIGLVTGANNFFLQNSEALERNKLSIEENEVVPIVSRAKIIPGINNLKSDFDREIKSGAKCYILNVNRDKLTKSQVDYLALFPAIERDSNYTFKHRQIWYKNNDVRIPDAFLPYMNHHGLHLTLNGLKLNCTNTIHRVFFNSEINNKLVAISMLTSFSQLSAEVEARSFGSGALKVEPSEAKRIRIALPRHLDDEQIEDAVNRIDKLLREGAYIEVRNIANELIFGSSPAIKKQLANIEIGLATARKIRRKN